MGLFYDHKIKGKTYFLALILFPHAIKRKTLIKSSDHFKSKLKIHIVPFSFISKYNSILKCHIMENCKKLSIHIYQIEKV